LPPAFFRPKPTKNPASGRVLGAQALFHEGFALVAFFVFGVGVAGLHFVLLRSLAVFGCCGLGAQAFLHEGFALIALFVFGISIASLHFALLSGGCLVICSVRAANCQSQTQSHERDQLLHL
jgi:hypothetical protein